MVCGRFDMRSYPLSGLFWQVVPLAANPFPARRSSDLLISVRPPAVAPAREQRAEPCNPLGAGIAPPFQVPKVHISSHFSPPPACARRRNVASIVPLHSQVHTQPTFANHREARREHSRK